MSKIFGFLNSKFKLEENGTNVRTEFRAGLTTFMAMVYILMVNAGMFSDAGVPYEAMYITTAISAIVGTVLIGLLAGLPLAQAPGMGLNAFFVYTVCLGFGLSYANALVLILVDGLVFIALTVTGLRKIIFDAIPGPVKKAIPAGIGLFIAFIGLQGAGIVVDDGSTLVNLTSFNLLGKATWASIMPVLVTILAFIAMGVLAKRGINGAVVYGILGGAVLYYVLGFTVPGFYEGFSLNMSNPLTAFAKFGTETFGKVFTEGFNFSAYLNKGNTVGSLVIVIITSSLAFCLVDMFDTMGTLYGACARGNLLVEKEDGEKEVPNMEKAMLADAIATTSGAIFGTSTVTTYVESSAGTAEGGKTGLTSIFTSLFFVLAMFLTPVAMLIPSAATNAALIYVGVLMMASVKDIDWTDIGSAIPAFLTVSFMPFTYNISYGIAFGIISYVLITLLDKKGYKKINVATYVIAALFIAMFLISR